MPGTRQPQVATSRCTTGTYCENLSSGPANHGAIMEPYTHVMSVRAQKRFATYEVRPPSGYVVDLGKCAACTDSNVSAHSFAHLPLCCRAYGPSIRTAKITQCRVFRKGRPWTDTPMNRHNKTVQNTDPHIPHTNSTSTNAQSGGGEGLWGLDVRR